MDVSMEQVARPRRRGKGTVFHLFRGNR